MLTPATGQFTFDFSRFQMDIEEDMQEKKEEDLQSSHQTGVVTPSPISSNSHNQTVSSTFPWNGISPAIPYTAEKGPDEAFAMRLSKRPEPVDGNQTPIFRKVIKDPPAQLIEENNLQTVEENNLQKNYQYLKNLNEKPDELILSFTAEMRTRIKFWMERFALRIKDVQGERQKEYSAFLKQLEERLSNGPFENYFNVSDLILK
jgi:hypothetical protein